MASAKVWKQTEAADQVAATQGRAPEVETAAGTECAFRAGSVPAAAAGYHAAAAAPAATCYGKVRCSPHHSSSTSTFCLCGQHDATGNDKSWSGKKRPALHTPSSAGRCYHCRYHEAILPWVPSTGYSRRI